MKKSTPKKKQKQYKAKYHSNKKKKKKNSQTQKQDMNNLDIYPKSHVSTVTVITWGRWKQVEGSLQSQKPMIIIVLYFSLIGFYFYFLGVQIVLCFFCWLQQRFIFISLSEKEDPKNCAEQRESQAVLV